MSSLSDGYVLNARLRGPDAIPTTRMVDALASLVFDMNQARQGHPVNITQWVEWVRKTKPNSDAIVRVLFLIVGTANLSIDDIRQLERDLRNTSQSRRRPPKLIREPGTRESQQLW